MRRGLLLAGFALLVLPSAAQAAFPGENGKIAFVEEAGLWTMNPDGTSPSLVDSSDAYFGDAWSPDGNRFAVVHSEGLGPLVIWVMNADGSGATRLAPATFAEYDPAWSPDGSRLAYVCNVDGSATVCTMRADGTDRQPVGFGQHPAWSPAGDKLAIAENPGDDRYGIYIANVDGSSPAYLPISGVLGYDGQPQEPDWSPAGDRVAFAWLGFDPNSNNEAGYVGTIRADGTDQQILHSLQGDYLEHELPHSPIWSPDGTKIAFIQDHQIRVMNADGSGNTVIRNSPTRPWYPSWQPILKGYARPKGAGTIHAPLVPAYAPCASPNRIHSPPLSYNSCNPPSRLSTQLTLGTPDANGQSAQSNSSLRIGVVPGNPATPADEAEANLKTSITDVRNASDLSDYTGNLEMRVPLHITDKSNTPYPGGPGPGTVQAFTFTWNVPCTSTADTNVGSTCALQTTADTLLPGSVLETRRAIWETDRIEVRDGNGDAFLRQGVFIP